MRLVPTIVVLALLCLLPRFAAAEGFQAEFVLAQSSPGDVSESKGRLEYLAPTTVYLATLSPIRQDLWFSPQGVTIYYPEQKLAMLGKGNGKGTAIGFDALALGIHQLDAAMFTAARLHIRTRTRDGKLRQHWQLRDDKGKVALSLIVLEGPEGMELLEVMNSDDKVTARYVFGPRTAVGTWKIPLTSFMEYFDQTGAPVRWERWTLSALAPLPAASSRQVGKTPELPPGTQTRDLGW